AGGPLTDHPRGTASGHWAGEHRAGRAVARGGAEPTFPPDEPRKRIDAVFATPGIEVLGCGVPAGLPGVSDTDLRAATDHLPVLAALRVPAAK
ncbi:endonuclease/exonuclease/phosphatase family protein, partial [Streptomyces rubiginosohelvolus]|uniref:endonuclease/exonuclease/phosphatase family protein n=1 Tax=Streptomyces rubiginosohelvolus TaxID=67362 RepID=UPI0036A52C65